MTRAASRRTSGLPAALAQAVAGLAAHVAAAGCLPRSAALALSVPAAVAAALLLGRLLPRRPLLRLAGGQLAVHALLALPSCAGAAHAHAHAGQAVPHLLMTAAHVVALVACRATLDAVAVGAERAAARLLALLRPLTGPPTLLLPELPVPAVRRRTVAPRQTDLHRAAPRRGPPRPLPA